MSDICKEYGEALFTLGFEGNCLDEIKKDLDLIKDIFEETPEYADFLQSPAVPKAERLKSINEAFENRVSEYTLSFLLILCEKGRATLFGDCAEEFNKLYEESKNISLARVFSPVPLSEEQKERLKLKLENISGQTVKMECFIDETLLGGVLIDMDGTQIDGTLKRRLQEIKEVMNK